jgi:murein DD-endopeptidase MepM/ murein hydrolase activator NlpD
LALLAALMTRPGVPAAADAQAYVIRGEWRQGALLIGRTDPGALVTFAGRRLRVSADGGFVFGLDRDEKPEVTLSVQLPGRTALVEKHAVASRDWEIQRIEGLPPAKVNPPPAAMRRIEAEAKAIKAAEARDTDITDFAGTFIWPVRGRVSSVFGSQRILNGTPKQPHYGVDVAVPIGTPVMAPAGGVVSLARRDLYFTGGTLIIDHGHGVSSILVHLSKLLVREGAVVKQGQVVAESGMTGRATGPHLHWGIYWLDAHVDPQAVLALSTPSP